MFSKATYFWCAAVVVGVVLGAVCISQIVSEFYHPMAVRDDLLSPLRRWGFTVPIIAAVTVGGLWYWRDTVPSRVYDVGLVLPVVTCLLAVLPKLDSGFRQTYWLGDERYEIHWQYSPYNGSSDRGGKYFVLKVSGPELTPRYETQNEAIIIGKAVDFNNGHGGAVPGEMCAMVFSRMTCQWKWAGSVYSASGKADLFPQILPEMMEAARDLLDGFEVVVP